MSPADNRKITRRDIVIVLLSGIALSFIGIALDTIGYNGDDVNNTSYGQSLIHYFLNFIFHLGNIFIGAAVIAFVLRIPSLLTEVNDSAINLFKNYEFLTRLDEKELMELRTRVTQAAYMKSANSPNDKLKVIDAQIASLFLAPYFSHFNIVIKCRRNKIGKYIEKTVKVDFTIINPKNDLCKILDHYKMRVTMARLGEEENDKIEVEESIAQKIELPTINEKLDKEESVPIKEGIDTAGIDENSEEITDPEILKLRRIESIKIRIDDETKLTDRTNDFRLKFNKYTQKDSMNYRYESNIVPKDPKNNRPLECNQSCTVSIIEKRIVSEEDNTYSHRVSSPTEQFEINYSFEKSDVDLKGTYFGTFYRYDDPDVSRYKDGNSIHISSRKWLLTGNGIIIVHSFPKE